MLFFALTMGLALQAQAENPVRVRIATQVEAAEFIGGPFDLQAAGRGFRVEWSEEKGGFAIHRPGKKALVLAGLQLPLGRVRWAQHSAAKSLEQNTTLFKNPHRAKFDIVIQVAEGDYLAGVLKGELPRNWPEQAVLAQWIASRSYLHAMQKERSKKHFDVDDSVLDQVFSPHLSPWRKRILLWSSSVRRQLLLDPVTNVPIKAYFHSHCGGRTTRPEKVWGSRSMEAQWPFPEAQDPQCQQDSLGRWQTALSQEEWRKLVGSDIESLVVHRDHFGERVLEFFTAKLGVRLTGQELRAKAGFARIKSTHFSIEKSAKGLIRLIGRGHGHGVGMCQWGARRLAEKGAGYQEILLHYYGLRARPESSGDQQKMISQMQFR